MKRLAEGRAVPTFFGPGWSRRHPVPGPKAHRSPRRRRHRRHARHRPRHRARAGARRLEPRARAACGPTRLTSHRARRTARPGLASTCRTTCAAISRAPTIARVSSSRSRARFGAAHALVNNAGRAPRVAGRSARGDRRELRRGDAHQPAGSVLPDAGDRRAISRAAARRSGLRGLDRLHHVGVRRHGVAEPWRILRQQGRPVDDRAAVRGAARGDGDSRLSRYDRASSRPT